MASARNPHGFVASVWLPHGFLMIRTFPDSFPISYMLDRHYHLMWSVLSACFPEGSPNIREAVRNAEASRIVCGRCRSTEDRRDVLMMSTGQCRQSAEGVPKFISASKFCSGPKSRRGKFVLSRRRRNVRKRSGAIKTVKGIFQEYADMLLNHADL